MMKWNAVVVGTLLVCQERGVPYGSPQVNLANVDQRIAEGFSFLMPGPTRESAALNRGRELAGR